MQNILRVVPGLIVVGMVLAQVPLTPRPWRLALALPLAFAMLSFLQAREKT
ncbi:MAG: hypothetical protein ACYCW6_18150 [Candidatus Xenobia bacterium]